MHVCIDNLTINASDNGLSPGRRQAIIWTNAGILLIEPLGTKFSEISIEIYTFSFEKMHLNMSSGKCWPFCLGLNVFIVPPWQHTISNWWNLFNLLYTTQGLSTKADQINKLSQYQEIWISVITWQTASDNETEKCSPIWLRAVEMMTQPPWGANRLKIPFNLMNSL